MKNFRLALGIALFGAIALTSCLKKNYDGPPDTSSYDPMLPVNYSISQLNTAALTGSGYKKVDTDYTISGIVVADDRSGNFYKQFVIQDSTGGIAIHVNAYDLYGDYPVGRKVYIKLKGLYIGNYHGLPQIGYGVDNSGSLVDIPGNLASNFIVKADFKDPNLYPDRLPLKHVTLAQAKAAPVSMLNTLITIDSVMEFKAADAGKSTYAQSADIASATDRYAENCSDDIDVRTSGYANFASYTLPAGRGSLTGVLTVYGTTAQLIIRDTTDVKFYGQRCDGAVIIDPNKIIFKEDFQTVGANNEILAVAGWLNFAEVGNVKYKGGVLGTSTKFAKVSAYQTGQATVKSWLVSPAINLTGASNPALSFTSNDGYDNGATLKVYISTDYNGSGDPTTGTWTELTGLTISSGHSSGYGSSFISSGLKSLSGYNGTVYLAFKYEGSDTNNKNTTFEIDDVIVSKD